MTELSDYQRLVEKPYRAKMDAKLATLQAENAELRAQVAKMEAALAVYHTAEQQQRELYDWVVSVCENPPEPNEKLKAMWAQYKDHPVFKDPKS